MKMTHKSGDMVFQIIVDDDLECINIFLENNRVGRFEFSHELEEFDKSGVVEYYLVTNLSLEEKYQRKGIGRAAFKFYKDCVCGIPIAARYEDGITRGDGSHITGVGLPFVRTMRDEGIISK